MPDTERNNAPALPAASTTTSPPRRGITAIDDWLDRNNWPPLIAVVLSGLLVRVFVALPTALNPDEAMHVLRTCMATFWDVYRADLAGPDPSLLHLILFPLCKFGASDFLLRLPSVLAGSGAILFIHAWLTELSDRTTGLIGAIILAFAPAFVYASTEVRAYAIVICFALSALYLLEVGLRRRSPLLLLLFGIAQSLALLSQYMAIILVFTAGCYSLYRILHERVGGRALAAWLAAEVGTIGLLGFLYLTHLSKLHGSAIESAMKTSVFRWLYFDPVRDRIMTFIWSRTAGAFNFLFTSSQVGWVALALFLAGVVTILARGIDRPGVGRGRWELGLLILGPWLIALTGGLLALYPFGRSRHVILLIIFAIAGIALLLGRLAGNRPALVLLSTLVLVPPWLITRLDYAAGWRQNRADASRTHILQAVEHVRQRMPAGGIVFSDLESHYVFRRYLFQSHEGTWRKAPPGFYEYNWNGFRMVTLDYWKVSADSLGNELQRLTESFGLEPGTEVCVASCGWTPSFAPELRKLGIEYPDVREFGDRVAILMVPAGEQVTTEPVERRGQRVRAALNSLASTMVRVARSRVQLVAWPSSCFDSTAAALAVRLGRLPMSYRSYYELAASGETPPEGLLPGLVFWVFGTTERHAGFASYMNDGENYIADGLRFTLLAIDADTVAAVFLIQPEEPER